MKSYLLHGLLIICLFTFSTPANTQCSPENALYFTGTLDRLFMRHSVPENQLTYTFEAWVRDDAPLNDFTLNRIFTGYLTNTVTERMEVGTEGGTFGIFEGNGFLSSGINIRDGNWHHIALVNDDTAVTIYLDGEPVINYIDVTDLANPLRIGNWNSTNPDADWIGPIDEIRIWSTARTQAELIENMNCVYNGAAEGLEGYHRFNLGDAGGDNTNITEFPNLVNGVAASTFSAFDLTGATSNLNVSNWSDEACVVSGQACNASGIQIITETEISFPNSICCATFTYTNNSGGSINGVRISQDSGNPIDAATFSSPIGLLITESDENGFILRLPDNVAFPNAVGEIFSFCFEQSDPPVLDMPSVVVEPLATFDGACGLCQETVEFDCVISSNSEFAAPTNFQVVPNPVADFIQINGITNSQSIQFELRDLLGRVIDVPVNGNQINTSRLPGGTYYLVIVDRNEGKREVHQVVKQ